MRMNTLRDVLEENVRDLHSVENQMVKAMARMGRAASHPDLKRAFEKNWMRRRGQLDRLEEIGRLLEISPKGGTCAAMRGLIEEGAEIIDADGDSEAKDAALIGAAQKLAHYGIAGYGTARTFAGVLGENQVANLLQATLDEEIAAEGILTEIAEFELDGEEDDADDLEETDEYEMKQMVLVRE